MGKSTSSWFTSRTVVEVLEESTIVTKYEVLDSVTMTLPWVITLSAAVNFYFVPDSIEGDVVATTKIAVIGAKNPAVVCDARAEMCNAILPPLQAAGIVLTSWNLEGFNYTLNLMSREILLKYDMILILQEEIDFVPLLTNLQLVNSQARFVIAWVGGTKNSTPDCCKKSYLESFNDLWKLRRIYRVVLLPLSCPGFAFTTDLPRNQCGECMHRISVSDERKLLEVFNKNIRNMYGHTLRVTMSPTQDLHRINSSDGIPYSGVDATILREFVRYINCTVAVETGAHAKAYAYIYRNGTKVGAALDLTYGTADMVFNGNFMYYLGKTPAELSTWYKEDALCVVIKKAGQIPKLVALFTPFSEGFLWAFFGMLGVVGCVLYGIRLIACLLGQPRTSFFDCLATASGFMMEATIAPKYRTNAERVLLASCSLWAIVVFGTYQGTLRGTLTIPKDLPDIKTLEELSEKGYSVYVSSETLLKVFSSSGNHLINRLQDRTIRVNTTAKPIEWPLAGIITRRGSAYRTVQVGQHMVPDCVGQSYLTFMARVGSPATHALNEMLTRFGEAGIITYYFETERQTQESRAKRSQKTQHPGEFTLADVQGAFVILAIGLLFDSLVLAFELLDDRTKI